jgi:hypothetical protein
MKIIKLRGGEMKFFQTFLAYFSFSMMGMTLISVSGCSPGTSKWREEVMLSDGRVIVVERETQFEQGGGEIVLNPGGIKPKEHRIRFTHPNEPGKVIEWRSTKLTPRRYPEKSLVLDLEDGNPVLYGSVYVRARCETYLKYVYNNDKWEEVTLPESFPQIKTNLLIKDGSKMAGKFYLPEKIRINNDIGYSKSLKIVGPNREICERQ